MRVGLHVLLQPVSDEGRLTNSCNPVDHHARMSLCKPAVQCFQFAVSSIDGTCGRRLIGVRRMHPDQRCQTTGFWHVSLSGLLDASKTNVAVGQDPFVLGMQQNLE